LQLYIFNFALEILNVFTMEEQKENSLAKSAMYYGALIGAALVLYTFIIYLTGQTTNRFLGFVQYFIIIGGIYYAVKKYRDESLNGFISYGKALGFGTLTIFFAALIIGFFTFILYSYIDPSMIDKILAISEDAMVARGMPNDQIDMAMEWTRKFTTPLALTISTVFGLTFMGFIFNLIISLIVKKNDDSFNSNFQ